MYPHLLAVSQPISALLVTEPPLVLEMPLVHALSQVKLTTVLAVSEWIQSYWSGLIHRELRRRIATQWSGPWLVLLVEPLVTSIGLEMIVMPHFQVVHHQR
jgi:hypothetical protein